MEHGVDLQLYVVVGCKQQLQKRQSVTFLRHLILQFCYLRISFFK